MKMWTDGKRVITIAHPGELLTAEEYAVTSNEELDWVVPKFNVSLMPHLMPNISICLVYVTLTLLYFATIGSFLPICVMIQVSRHCHMSLKNTIQLSLLLMA